MKRIFVAYLALLNSIYCQSISLYHYLGDIKYELQLTKERLIELKGIDPYDSNSIQPTISQVAKSATTKFNDMNKGKNNPIIDHMKIKNVCLTHICNTSENVAVWIWEVKFESDEMGAKNQFSIYIDKNGNALIPIVKNTK